LRPCCEHGGAPSPREGPSPILVLLTPRSKREQETGTTPDLLESRF